MKKYYTSIDLLRGIAAIMVTIFHFTHHNSVNGTLINENDILHKLSYFGQYGVHLFFVISGFVIPYSMQRYNYNIKKIGSFLLKRIIRIEPPYILSIIWIIFSGIFFSIYLDKEIIIEWKKIILHIGYLIPFSNQMWYNDIYWTLAVEFQYYIFIAITFPLFFNKNKIIRNIILSTMFLFPIVNNEGLFVNYTPIFGLGILGTMLELDKITKKNFIFWLIIYCFSILYFHGCYIFIISLITLFIIIRRKQIKTKTSSFLGNISYSLYLTHGELGGKLIYFLFPFFSESLFLSYSLLIIAIIFSIFGAWIFCLLIEIPSKKLASKIKL